MTRVGGIGCALIGLGPSTMLFFLTVVISPLKLIVVTGSGFVWILSLLLTSLVWIVLNLLTSHIASSLVVAVLSQELMRFVFYKLIIMADNGLQVVAASLQACSTRPVSHLTSSNGEEPVTDARPTISGVTCESSVSFRPKKERADNLLNHGGVAYVAGLGFGLMGCIFELLPNVTLAFGPGVGFETWKSKTFFVVAAFEVMCLSLLQIFWSIILFEAYKRKSYGHIIVVISTHILLSCLSLLNQFNYPWPEVVCTVYLLSLFAAAVYTYASLGDRHCNTCQPAAHTSDVT
ncbi:hypothetical protein EG68_09004 [Paragonimus skrjabini miyazakii]|uniref:Gamma-secretase subunit Aph-1 n=1 Tax=Paragonimus skrjabini miyazakii TaxID=59628 RepID=A0A8S9YUC5_9TREM|nr:hypothetical protein EG68_09004 [Paragonimus skrjabini miyazakii]